MKKTVLLNAPISSVVARLGHGNSLCIADAGLPVPNKTERIDIAVSAGVPRLLDVLSAVTSEMFVERAIIASEFEMEQPQLHGELRDLVHALGVRQKSTIKIDVIPHEDFKIRSHDCLAVVRTGECTPYANIILCSGVTF